MSIRRRCTERNCKNGRRCLEHLRFDVSWRGHRYRMPVNDYAIPRMEPGRQRPIQSMEEARDWERRFIGEVKAGFDPQRPPTQPRNESTDLENVSAFLDAYFERCVKPAALRSIGTVRSQIGVLKEHFGNFPLAALEEADEINRFKTDSEWAEDVETASIHRVLERLRAAMNWGMAQTPPLFTRSPFHRFGVRMNKKAETVRDRRVSREEEKRLLDTALLRMNTAAHMYTGELLHDRIIGALELCCRRGEMLLIQNKRVKLGPAASGCLRTVNQPCGPTDCPRIVPAEWKSLRKVAPQAGLEPATLRLTAGCSAIELLRNTGGPAGDARTSGSY